MMRRTKGRRAGCADRFNSTAIGRHSRPYVSARRRRNHT